MGNISKVVKQLSKERIRLANELHKVIAALTAFGKVYLDGAKPPRKKRTMLAAGRKRIAAAQRARWAKQEQKPKRILSASARRKIAAAQRARWAKAKAQQKKAA